MTFGQRLDPRILLSEERTERCGETLGVRMVCGFPKQSLSSRW